MPPTSKKLTGHIGYGLCIHASVRSSRTVHAGVFKVHIRIPHGKIIDAYVFSCTSYIPFWSYAPLKKSRMKSDSCCILRTLHARVLKFHIWIPHGKIADPYFYAPNFEAVVGAYWFRVVRPSVHPCVHASVGLSKTVHAKVLKFHIWIPHGKIADPHFFCLSYLPLKKSEWNLVS